MNNKIITIFLPFFCILLLTNSCKKEDKDEVCRSEVCFHNNSMTTKWVCQQEAFTSGNIFEVSIPPNSQYCEDLNTGTGYATTFRSGSTLLACSSAATSTAHHLTVAECGQFDIDL